MERGYVGLRALATGLPASFLLNPRRALAADPAPACSAPDKAQYIILNTSGQGDPINASVPGTYDDPAITHSADPVLAATPLTLRGRATIGGGALGGAAAGGPGSHDVLAPHDATRRSTPKSPRC